MIGFVWDALGLIGRAGLEGEIGGALIELDGSDDDLGFRRLDVSTFRSHLVTIASHGEDICTLAIMVLNCA